jgi:hypothetical protein
MPMIANIKVSPTSRLPEHTPGGGQISTLDAFHRLKIQTLHDGVGRGSGFRQIASLARVLAVEGFSTLVPFSINRYPTNVVGEQFWGRAARAFLTRKSRNACFVFRIIFDPSFAYVSSRDPVKKSKKGVTHA